MPEPRMKRLYPRLADGYQKACLTDRAPDIALRTVISDPFLKLTWGEDGMAWRRRSVRMSHTIKEAPRLANSRGEGSRVARTF